MSIQKLIRNLFIEIALKVFYKFLDFRKRN